jgi:hypothetical protein
MKPLGDEVGQRVAVVRAVRRRFGVQHEQVGSAQSAPGNQVASGSGT